MDQLTIEKLSVNIVSNSIIMCPLLCPYISENDKEPSWDGFVYIYETEGHNKDTITGRLAVQVKGTKKDDFSKENITFPMDVSDLKNYLADGGIILFVVYLNDLGHNKIYYSELTPIRLSRILREKREQQTISVQLKAFPDNINDKTTIFLNCYQNCQKQKSYAVADLPTIDQLQDAGVLEGLVFPFSGVGMSEKDIMRAFTNSDVYMYARVKGNPILQPLDILPAGFMRKREIKEPISIDGKEYYSHYYIEEYGKRSTIKFGHGFSLVNDNDKVKFNYDFPKMARIAAVDLDFLVKFIQHKGFEINHNKIPFEDNNLFQNADMDLLARQCDFAKKCVALLDYLHCNKDLDFSGLAKEDFDRIYMLYSALIEKNPIKGLKFDDISVLTVTISKLKFLVFAKKDSNGDAIITDFFEADLEVFSESDSGRIPNSKYSLLHALDIIEIDNFVMDGILDSFKELNCEEKYDYANYFLLELLIAYDMSTGKNKELLKLCYDFAIWLYENPNRTVINTLNYFQTIKRERPLNSDESKMLWNMIEDDNVTVDCKTAAYLLLDLQTPAENCFNKLRDEQKEEFRKYPIYHFWKSPDAQ